MPNPPKKSIKKKKTKKKKKRIYHNKITVMQTFIRDKRPEQSSRKKQLEKREKDIETFDVTPPLKRNKLNNDERDVLAELVSLYIRDLTKILEISRQDLSIKLGKNKEYLSRLSGNIKQGRITSIAYFKRLDLFFDIFKSELVGRQNEKHKRGMFLNLHFSHLKNIKEYVKRELFVSYQNYRTIVENKGWKILTDFKEFFEDFLIKKFNPSDYSFKLWCGKKGHDIKYCLGKNINFRFTNIQCFLCEPARQSIKYSDIIILAWENGYSVVKPSTSAEWIKMILSDKNSPTHISIILYCNDHGPFSSTYNRLKSGHLCPDCWKLSINDIINRGKEYGLMLVTPPNQIRRKLTKMQPLEWTCIIHGIKVKVRPFLSEFTRTGFCLDCSKKKISYERVIRYFLSIIFKTTQFGYKPKYPQNIKGLKFQDIIKNHRIKDFLNTHGIIPNGYYHFTIDCFGVIKIAGRELKISVDIWGPQHENLYIYKKMYPKRSLMDYYRQKQYDNLRKILFEEHFVDIHIVVPLWKLKNNRIISYIIKNLEKQFFECGILLNNKFPTYTWAHLVKDIRFAKDYKKLDID